MDMTKVRALGLVLLAALTFCGTSALASNVGDTSNAASNKDAASVKEAASAATAAAHQRHRVRRVERYRGSDGRWHEHYVYVYVWM
jgi:hypothetical protein